MAKVFSYRILVVDNDESVLRTSAAMLSDAGYEVKTAHDGFEALAGLRGGLPEVLIIDLHMAVGLRTVWNNSEAIPFNRRDCHERRIHSSVIGRGSPC